MFTMRFSFSSNSSPVCPQLFSSACEMRTAQRYIIGTLYSCLCICSSLRKVVWMYVFNKCFPFLLVVACFSSHFETKTCEMFINHYPELYRKSSGVFHRNQESTHAIISFHCIVNIVDMCMLIYVQSSCRTSQLKIM